MPRAKKTVKKPAHRPQIEINWGRVDELLMYGCPGTKIAASIGIHPETLYYRCEQEKGIGFTEYSRQKKECGDNLIQEAQFKKALGITDKGDNTLLIWLGKTRLDQKENAVEVSVSEETMNKFDGIMSQLRDLQQMKKDA